MRTSGVLLALAGAALAAGCLSRSFPERQRFHLATVRPGPPEQACDCSARVERLRVAQLFEGRSFVYRTRDRAAEEDFWNQFFASPGGLIREEAKNWLIASGLFGRLLPATAPVRADWLIEGHVTALYADMREKQALAVLEIEWALLDDSSRELEVAFTRTYGGSLELADRRTQTIADGWGELLGRILTDFEADLREFFVARAAEDAEEGV